MDEIYTTWNSQRLTSNNISSFSFFLTLSLLLTGNSTKVLSTRFLYERRERCCVKKKRISSISKLFLFFFWDREKKRDVEGRPMKKKIFRGRMLFRRRLEEKEGTVRSKKNVVLYCLSWEAFLCWSMGIRLGTFQLLLNVNSSILNSFWYGRWL